MQRNSLGVAFNKKEIKFDNAKKASVARPLLI
jgi:hypothetical protein